MYPSSNSSLCTGESSNGPTNRATRHVTERLIGMSSWNGGLSGHNTESLTVEHIGVVFGRKPPRSLNRIGGIMVSVLTSNVVDRGFELQSGQTKDYEIGICCFSAKHAALRRKSKDWLSRNQNNVSVWSDMSTRRLLFQWASTIKIQLSVLV